MVVEDGGIVEDGVPSQLSQSQSRYRDLLDAEAEVASQIWRGDYWRRIELADGVLVETGAAQ